MSNPMGHAIVPAPAALEGHGTSDDDNMDARA